MRFVQSCKNFVRLRRVPDEVMTEMWIDFPSRRLRVKCGLHDALGWSGSFAARN